MPNGYNLHALGFSKLLTDTYYSALSQTLASSFVLSGGPWIRRTRKVYEKPPGNFEWSGVEWSKMWEGPTETGANGFALRLSIPLF
ncbi:hypothetical protein H0H93_005467, partial [Arthromyces matolae]